MNLKHKFDPIIAKSVERYSSTMKTLVSNNIYLSNKVNRAGYLPVSLMKNINAYDNIHEYIRMIIPYSVSRITAVDSAENTKNIVDMVNKQAELVNIVDFSNFYVNTRTYVAEGDIQQYKDRGFSNKAITISLLFASEINDVVPNEIIDQDIVDLYFTYVLCSLAKNNTFHETQLVSEIVKSAATKLHNQLLDGMIGFEDIMKIGEFLSQPIFINAAKYNYVKNIAKLNQ